MPPFPTRPPHSNKPNNQSNAPLSGELKGGIPFNCWIENPDLCTARYICSFPTNEPSLENVIYYQVTNT
jgi:hypothetical protein